jgi:hypothetical protein
MAFPEDFIQEVILPTTNIHLSPHLTMQEFYKWLGCHFFMACFQGIDDQDNWWSQQPVSMFDGAPFGLNEYMTKSRFINITSRIPFTNKEAPSIASNGFVDWFHKVRQMLDAFNNHYDWNYVASWLSCLDELMSSWLSKFCPEFMCVPRKPHLFEMNTTQLPTGIRERQSCFGSSLLRGRIGQRRRMGCGRSRWSLIVFRR